MRGGDESLYRRCHVLTRLRRSKTESDDEITSPEGLPVGHVVPPQNVRPIRSRWSARRRSERVETPTTCRDQENVVDSIIRHGFAALLLHAWCYGFSRAQFEDNLACWRMESKT